MGEAFSIDLHEELRRPSQLSDSDEGSKEPEPVMTSAFRGKPDVSVFPPHQSVLSHALGTGLPGIRPLSIDPVLIPLPMVFAQMPPLFHPFTPLPKAEPNGPPCAMRDGSSTDPFDEVPTFPKRFLVWRVEHSTHQQCNLGARDEAALPVLPSTPLSGAPAFNPHATDFHRSQQGTIR